MLLKQNYHYLILSFSMHKLYYPILVLLYKLQQWNQLPAIRELYMANLKVHYRNQIEENQGKKSP